MSIPGTTKLERLKENSKAAALDLSLEDIRTITKGAEQIEAKGTRYPEAMMKDVYRKI